MIKEPPESIKETEDILKTISNCINKSEYKCIIALTKDGIATINKDTFYKTTLEKEETETKKKEEEEPAAKKIVILESQEKENLNLLKSRLNTLNNIHSIVNRFKEPLEDESKKGKGIEHLSGYSILPDTPITTSFILDPKSTEYLNHIKDIYLKETITSEIEKLNKYNKEYDTLYTSSIEKTIENVTKENNQNILESYDKSKQEPLIRKRSRKFITPSSLTEDISEIEESIKTKPKHESIHERISKSNKELMDLKEKYKYAEITIQSLRSEMEILKKVPREENIIRISTLETTILKMTEELSNMENKLKENLNHM